MPVKKNTTRHYPRHGVNITRMSQALAQAFVMHPDNYRILLQIYNVPTIEGLFEQWVIESLLHPDDELTQILLPQLVSRFNNQLEDMRRKAWLR